MLPRPKPRDAFRRALRAQLMVQAPAVLGTPGAMLLECDPAQARRLTRLARGYWPDASITIHKDLAGRDRVVRVEVPS